MSGYDPTHKHRKWLEVQNIEFLEKPFSRARLALKHSKSDTASIVPMYRCRTQNSGVSTFPKFVSKTFKGAGHLVLDEKRDAVQAVQRLTIQ